jgi:hypothetical protein
VIQEKEAIDTFVDAKSGEVGSHQQSSFIIPSLGLESNALLPSGVTGKSGVSGVARETEGGISGTHH